jgi:hypothetical protein
MSAAVLTVPGKNTKMRSFVWFIFNQQRKRKQHYIQSKICTKYARDYLFVEGTVSPDHKGLKVRLVTPDI